MFLAVACFALYRMCCCCCGSPYRSEHVGAASTMYPHDDLEVIIDSDSADSTSSPSMSEATHTI
jgi:hypothetical protein